MVKNSTKPTATCREGIVAKLNIPHFRNGQKPPEDYIFEKYKDYKVISIYSEDNIEYQRRIKNLGLNPNPLATWHPYPFNIEYCPFWDRENKCLIPKNLIATDWVEGIIWIFTKTKEWFENDAIFFADKYYNWTQEVDKAGCVFIQNWNKKTSMEQLCKDYEIPFKEYQAPKDMVTDIVAYRRAKYLNEIDKILKFYS